MEEDNEEEISTRHKDEGTHIWNERKKTNKTIDAEASQPECGLAK